jgi:hypothetical protein
MTLGFIKDMEIILGGERIITKGGMIYKIGLPVSLNDIWRELHEKMIKVKVYLEIRKQLKEMFPKNRTE